MTQARDILVAESRDGFAKAGRECQGVDQPAALFGQERVR